MEWREMLATVKSEIYLRVQFILVCCDEFLLWPAILVHFNYKRCQMCLFTQEVRLWHRTKENG
jgi:hypothetical protein